jgi:hypothetical protein
MVAAKKIQVEDPLQPKYAYALVAQTGKQFDLEFKPHLTPREMLELGVFGGMYFEGETDEFPKSWVAHAKTSTSGRYEKTLNFFGVKASQPRAEWARKGWLYADDPRGWFQWYCRYYLGRRLPKEDARQVRRWKAFARHAYQVAANCRKGDFTCRPVQRQALLHWAYDSRKL